MKTTLLSYMACLAGLLLLMQCSPRPVHNTSPAPVAGVLLGVQERTAFRQPPFQHWFDSFYQAYTVQTAAIASLKKVWQNEQVDIFLGTWCGDSRREVPRMLKVLDSLGVPASNIRLICTKSGQPGHKTSPGREEQGLYIFRVPTFIIRRHHLELGRIVEFPVATLEKDLLDIVSGAPYESNYRAGNYIRRLFDVKSPELINDSLPVVAAALKPLARNEGELSSFGSVLLSAGDYSRAITVFRLNTLLFAEKADSWHWLAEGYRRNHDRDKAIVAYERTLALQPGLTLARQRLDSLKAL
ncbi:hypothetical protein EGT74_22190 [Chitinophaga lutea]|uniref:Uncharacterized protein n=1 Tax=Chitinophaga lutea TaxID=2488634 RepID=A0A3N4Q087_9BACT|nr:hypothetical protein [Chitinophaga lutea]RPE09687.1 hypothetical protein EGT74_22190 [Chitinophaga lutea]